MRPSPSRSSGKGSSTSSPRSSENSSARIALGLKISGLVHGVFFRASLAKFASNLGVAGWVRNIPDGSVEALLEGEEVKVMKVVEWAHHGPPRARVDSVKIESYAVRNLRGFRIDG